MRFDLDREDIEDACDDASAVDLTNVAERELNHEAEAAMRDH